MKKIPTFWLALIVGVILEGAIVLLSLIFASYGRDLYPNNFFTEFIMIIHWPGVIAARFLQPVDSHDFDYTIILTTTAVLWSVVAFVVIGILRRFYGRKSKPAA